MAQLALCIGSNENAAANIRLALKSLRELFGSLRCSRVYRGAAVGFEGPDFLNLAALVDTDDFREAATPFDRGGKRRAAPMAAECGGTLPQVVAALKRLEVRLGRTPSSAGFCSRPIDIDVFVPGVADGAFGRLALPHREVLENAHVLCPLAELLPRQRLTPSGPDLAELWSRFDKTRQALTVVDIA